jgi:hypothetical protein
LLDCGQARERSETVETTERQETREQKGLRLYAEHGKQIERLSANLFVCPSQSGEKVYFVTYGNLEESCTCPANTYRPEEPCKHLLAVAIRSSKVRAARQRANDDLMSDDGGEAA